MNEKQFKVWVQNLLDRHPEVVWVGLIGSRASGKVKDDADWDVVVRLDPGCYLPVTRLVFDGLINTRRANMYEQIGKAEQEVAFDLQLLALDPGKDIDLFFLRPDGAIGQWTWFELEDLAHDTVLGLDHLKRLLDYEIGVLEIGGAAVDLELAYALAGRLHEQDEKRIQNQLPKARTLFDTLQQSQE